MRKAIFFTLLFLLGLSTFSQAQVRESQRKMSQGTHAALVLSIPDVEDKFIRDLWSDYIKDFYDTKTKRNRKTKEYFSDNAEIVALGGNNPVDLYATFEEDKDDVEMNVWIDLGGAFLNSTDHPDRFKEAEKIMMRFALEVAKETTKVELEEQEEMLEDLEDDLKKLKKNNDRYHKAIENAKKKIAEAEDDIVENEKEQEAMVKKIAEQMKAVEAVKKKLNDL